MSRLQAIRMEAGLSQEELARKAGLTLSGLRQVETGRRTPQLKTAQAIARALGRSVDDIWSSEEATP